MKCINATNLNRKSGGAQPRDLRCARLPHKSLRENVLDKMMGAPGPRFPAKFSGFPALYAPFRVERRTRGPVQH